VISIKDPNAASGGNPRAASLPRERKADVSIHPPLVSSSSYSYSYWVIVSRTSSSLV
jgi:hypothetical protein